MFKRVEVKKTEYLKTKMTEPGVIMGPHQIALQKGPEYIRLTSFQDLSWRTMGRLAKQKVGDQQGLDENLLRAQMKIRPEEYLAYVYMATLVATIVGVVIAVVVGVILLNVIFARGILNTLIVAGLSFRFV